MRKLVTLVFVILLTLPQGVFAANVQDFKIPRFEADYYLSSDKEAVSELRVEERITAIFPNFNQNHGILRAIPESYDGHGLELSIISVKNAQDQNVPYETYSENGNLVLQIGEADTYVHGEQIYKISYLMRGVTLNLDDHDELYWDVNGDQWQQQMTNVEARVHLTPELAAKLQDQKFCFTGSFGETNQFCDITTNDSLSGKTITVKSDTALDAGQTLTFALLFNSDAFVAYKPSAKVVLRWVAIAAVVVLPPVIALIIVVRNWRRYGRDPKGRGIIVPEYLPPKNITVLESNALLTERFESKAISAQIIDLAVRHFIKIYEIKENKLIGHKTDYEIEYNRDGELAKEEREVLSLIFGSQNPRKGDKVKLGSISKTLATKVQKLGKDINSNLATKGYFRVAPEKAKTPYIVVGAMLMVVGFVFVPWTIGLILAGLIVMIASGTMPARTALGVEKRDHLLGLKMYMQLAEAERIKVLQSPQGTLTEKVNVDDKKQLVKLYERLLPYAMLFGIEKEWAKQLAHLYEQEPSWYSGSTTFNSVVFASTLSSFESASAASFAPPSSGGSGGSGGFSGGGGGGGGGGGW
ncbi:MAG TPA: DUF2207 domain-containing protein [Candidatus Saccharimonadales bacterium]|nr:DUF2207 domain-containing protein [Candidatus Saccharimonadales bacterium]